MRTATAADRIRLYVAGPQTSEQAALGRDIARHIGRPANLDIEIYPLSGTPAALRKLHETDLLQLAMLQTDVLHAYREASRRERPEAERMFDSVDAIALLHREDIHFVVRSDSRLEYLHDLAAARINIGPPQSGNALSAALLYRLMFGQGIPDQQIGLLSTEAALVRLITDKSVDAVAVVAPRPANALAKMKPGARNFVKLLKLDLAHPSAARLAEVYSSVTVAASDYPNLLERDQTALAVDVVLAAAGHGPRRDTLLARFSRAWCEGIAQLQTNAPPAWQALSLSTPIPAGWRTSRIFQREQLDCLDGIPPATPACQQADRQIGLCE